MDDAEEQLSDENLEQINEGEEISKKISPTFCNAKWFDLQVKLGIGVMHSCCKIPRGSVNFFQELQRANLDINENLDLFNNYPSRLAEREQMLKGEQLKNCSYCWNVENQGVFHSYRRFHNRWELDALKEATTDGKTIGVDPHTKPSVVELSFSNVCTFKCLYCGVENSSSIEAEFYKHGPLLERDRWQVRLREDKASLLNPDGTNKLEAAFWRWWETVFPGLRMLKLTGGEPLLDKRVWRLLETLKSSKNSKLTVTVITNLSSIPDDSLTKLASTLNELIETGCIKNGNINCSLDSVDERTEYVRNGLNLKEFLRKYELLIGGLNSQVKVSILPTFSILTILSAPDLVRWFVNFRSQFKGRCELMIGASYVLDPRYLNIANLTPRLKDRVRSELKPLLKELSDKRLLTPYELTFFQQVFSVLDREPDPTDQNNLKVALAELDRRRGTDRFKTFPELAELL